MKKLKRLFLFFYLVAVFNTAGKAQLFSENFNFGVSANWTQSPAATWSLNANLGSSGSGCIFTQEAGSASITTTIHTPTVNVNGLANFTVSFIAASVANNFVGPNVTLFYDAGNGPQFLARWGSGFSANTTYTLLYSSDYQPPLDAQNMSLSNCTHTFASLPASIVKFVFAAEFVNGGYVVLDDIAIAGKTAVTAGVEENDQHASVRVFPNPTHDKRVRLEGIALNNLIATDNLGRITKVKTLKINERAYEIDLSDFPDGRYFLTLFTADNICIRKKIVLE